MEHVLVQLALLAVIISSGEAVLKCYSCTSMTNKECADPFVPKNLIPVDCTAQKMQQALSNLATAFSSISSKFGIDNPLGGTLDVGADAHWTCMKMDFLDPTGKNYTLRDCRVPNSDSPALDLCKHTPSGMTATFCNGCEGDGCNGAGRLGGGVAMLFYLLLPSVVALKAVAA